MSLRLLLSRGVYDQYPDDASPKPVRAYADRSDGIVAGERHVSLNWENTPAASSSSDPSAASSSPASSAAAAADDDALPTQIVLQCIHLTGGPGNYSHHSPSAHARPAAWAQTTPHWPLGTFTRAQRDEILALAKGLKYDRRSRVNNCQVWLRELLDAMVGRGLVGEEVVQTIGREVPLIVRRPEPEKRESDEGNALIVTK